MGTKLKWGILGTGKIAKTFSQGLKGSATGELVAVGSRTRESAEAFGAETVAQTCHASYEALLADPEVECVYISLPHTYHVEWSIRAAHAGKHILCEKPMALNHAEAEAVFSAVRANDVFFMEAFMYRCHPQTHRLAELVRTKVIGDTRSIDAVFSFTVPYDPTSRLLSNELAGGGILDVGCYTTSLSNLLAGAANGKDFLEPLELKALGHLGKTGVDEYTSAVAKYPGDIIARMTTGVQLDQQNSVWIYGTEGSIFVPEPWKPSELGGTSKIVVNKRGQAPVDVLIENPKHLYALEADAVAASISRRECPFMSWADSLVNLRTMDRWRNEIGLVYDIEKSGQIPSAVL
ncbi:MAG: Gfo/Idh/MocA family oxidoreductase [Planctomycetota bacterium]